MSELNIFELKKKDGEARRGRLTLKRGIVETPVFMPVGTAGSVKTMTPEDLRSMGAQIILGNTYHLFLRPGREVIRHFDGLHKFINWDRPMLTDSGGFQIFSLGKLNKLTEEGAHFQSHIDGSRFQLNPELAVEIQEELGSDIHMALDECTPYPATFEQAKTSMQRSMRWAKRCRQARTKMDLAQFGIVQGSMFEDLRKESAEALMEIGFEGYAIGGVSVGETKEEMRFATRVSAPMLPEDKPRYLMGVGTPLDLIESVSMGIDMFDCVMPTRNARNGTIFTSLGRVNITGATHRLSDEPLDPACSCYTCKTFTRGYLRHLIANHELTAHRVLSLHNLWYYQDLMRDIRSAIEENRFAALLAHHQSLWDK